MTSFELSRSQRTPSRSIAAFLAAVLVVAIAALIPVTILPAETPATAPAGLSTRLVALHPIAPIESLKAAAEWELSAIEQAYTRRQNLSAAARMLACFGQAIGDHPDAGEVACNGYALRDAALRIADAANPELVAPAIAETRSALARRPRDASHPAKVARFTSLGFVMHEFERRISELRPVVRKKFADRQAAEALVTGLTVLALSLEPDEQSKGRKADARGWDECVAVHVEQTRRLSAAIKANDPAEAVERMIAMRTNCTACHKQYRQ